MTDKAAPMKDKAKLLIVEDEPAIRAGLIDVFTYHGFEVEAAADGKTGLDLALRGRFDLVLLDVMLPGIDGFEICRHLRAENRERAIIMLTAKSTDDDIIQGLTLGADDYVSKPFSVTELVLRVNAVLRRTRPPLHEHLVLASDLSIDTQNLEGSRAGVAIQFTRREMDVLQYLYAQRNRAVPREDLLHRVWGFANAPDLETRTVDIHIAKLRRKLEIDPANPVLLVTVRGAGYRLLAP